MVLETGRTAAAHAPCGIPLDSTYFDESGITSPPPPGRREVLARFELPPRYCGVLEYFAQYTDLQSRDPSRIETPELEWSLLVNQRPLYPYLQLKTILNPWGNGSFEIWLRLEENAVLEFVVKSLSAAAPGNEIGRVGGRIVGRYWYNPAYGDVERSPY